MLRAQPREVTTHTAFCNLPFTKVILNGWGDVSMCCYQYHQLGSVLKSNLSVLDLWNSPQAQAIRDETTTGRLHESCKSWNTCPYLVSEKKEYIFEVNSGFAYPTYLELCLPNTHCNIGGETPSDDNPACIMCCRNYDMEKQPQITDLLCEKALPLMPYLKSLCVLGVSEPFWKDALFRVFKKLRFDDHKFHIRFNTNTNVVCLVERSVRRYFAEVHESDMNFSIDAATPETYQKIRRIDAYELVIKNCKNFMKARDENGGSSRHQVIIYNNINLINVHEMVGMVETAADLGVDKLIMLPTHDQCGRVKMNELLLNNRNLKIFANAAHLAWKRSEELGVHLHYSKPFHVVPPPIGQELQPPQQLVELRIERKKPSEQT